MKIGIIGAGAMGGAVASGLVESGINPSDITISNPHVDKLKVFGDKGLNVTVDNLEVCRGADLLFVAVKPWILPGVAEEIRNAVCEAGAAVSVIAAGITGEDLLRWFDCGGKVPVLSLSMPNTAVKCGQSMTFVVPVTGDENNPDVELYRRLGDVSVIEERLLPAATSLASCGIAYALRYIRAATEGGVQLGFRASEAQRIVAQTVKGAAALLEDGAHAEAEIDKVTTPGGLTIRGLNAMEQSGFTAAVVNGLINSK
ncbi:MAG: NAD(P)-binding domain-containing protein [Muribaculaceae bacterium]|nr:NAD(P)-binding domain-containing protein [Muribaculaceae bacterium]